MNPCSVFQKLGAAFAVELTVYLTFGKESVPQESWCASGQVSFSSFLTDPPFVRYPGIGIEYEKPVWAG